MLKAVSYTFLIKILGYITGYLLVFVITRNFGAGIYGDFSSYLSIVMILETISGLGLGNSIVRYLSRKTTKEYFKFLYKNSALITCGIGFALGICLYYFSELIADTIFNKDISLVLKFAGLSIVPAAMLKLHANFFRALSSPVLYAFFIFTSKSLLASLLLILLVWVNVGDVNVTKVYFVSLCFLMIASGALVWGLRKQNHSEVIPHNFKEVFTTALNMVFSNAALIMMSWIDTVMLTAMGSQVDVGYYNVALKLGLITTISMVAVNSVIGPKISEFWHKHEMKGMVTLAKKGTHYIFVSTLVIVFGIIIMHDWLLSLFGSEFSNSKTALFIILGGQLINAICGPSAQLLQMTNYEKEFRNILIVTMLVNVVLNYFLIQAYSINGAALASAISVALWNLTCVVVIRLKFKFWTLPFIKVNYARYD